MSTHLILPREAFEACATEGLGQPERAGFNPLEPVNAPANKRHRVWDADSEDLPALAWHIALMVLGLYFAIWAGFFAFRMALKALVSP